MTGKLTRVTMEPEANRHVREFLEDLVGWKREPYGRNSYYIESMAASIVNIVRNADKEVS